MNKTLIAAALAAASLCLTACGGGGGSAANESADVAPGGSINAADGINTTPDASGTTGSSTGDAGGPLIVAVDAKADAGEANGASANGH